jgi:hypothetical protein
MFACAAKLAEHFGRTIAPVPNPVVGARWANALSKQRSNDG